MGENTTESWTRITDVTSTETLEAEVTPNVSVPYLLANYTTPISGWSVNLTLSFSPTSDNVPIFFHLANVTDRGDNTSGYSNSTPRLGSASGFDRSLEFQIPIYVLIFLLSVVGNILVIATVVHNKKMRSVTNVFLLNLSLSDLLLAVFCMPFTLVPLFLKNFIFGEVMCVLVRYMQGVSVAVSCFTLVAISLERYFAICHPLKSRSWQTLSHSYKAIAVCWVAAFALMVPLAVYHDLLKIGPDRHLCAETWPSTDGLQAYTVILDLLLLVLPFVVMGWAYGCVCYTLWVGIKLERESEKETQTKLTAAQFDSQNGVSLYANKKAAVSASSDDSEYHLAAPFAGSVTAAAPKSVARPFRRIDAHRAMRQSNTERSRAAKRRVIKMLFMVVLEFFIFWTPTYVISTWIIFDQVSAFRHVTPMTKSLVHLLSYVSACCNPITYCFMNKNFRQSFLMAFRCMKSRYVYAHRSEMSFTSGANTMSTRAPPTPPTATSYDQILESEEISENSF